MKLRIVTTTAALALLAAPAFAGGFGNDWTGPSIGLQVGEADVDTSGVANLSGDDTIYGVTAYYDFDLGSTVLGFGVELDNTDVDLGGVASVDRVLRVGARAGLDSGRNLFYVAAGYAEAKTEDGTAAVGDGDGYFYGLGYEVFITESITASAQLFEHDFDDFSLAGLEAEATTFQLGVNLRF